MTMREATSQPGIFRYQTKGGPRYRVVVDGGRDDDGKRRQLTRAGIATMKEAVRVRDELRREGGARIAGSVRFGAFVGRWLGMIEPTVRPVTVARYERALARYVLPTLGTRSMGEITPSDIQALETALLAAGRSPATVRLVHVVVHRVFKAALRLEIVGRNPVEAVDAPALPPSVGKVWTAEECRRFLAATADEPHGPLWALLLATSMRIGEALALTWGAVDLKAGTVAVVQTLTRDRKHRWYVGEPKTDRARRVVALGPVGLSALGRLPRGLPGAFVFPGEVYGFLEPRSVWRAFRAACLRHGLPVLRVHDLRHTAITLAIEAGVPLGVVSGRAGHSSYSITADRYSHLTPAPDGDAASVLSSVLMGGAAKSSGVG
jgi:integrase